MAKGPEKKIQDKIVAYARSRGCMVVRMAFMPGVNAGCPDLLVVCPNGITLWIEVKTPAGKLTKRQEVFIEELTLLGQVAAVARTPDDGAALVDAALEAGQ